MTHNHPFFFPKTGQNIFLPTGNLFAHPLVLLVYKHSKRGEH